MDFPKEKGSPLRKLWKTVQACKENKTFNTDVKKKCIMYKYVEM